MDKNSEEYRKYKADYEAKEEYKRTHPEEYPWFVYFQFGWHNMTYMTDAEVEEAVKFYRGMIKSKDEKGHDRWERYGRQPIFITWSGDRKDEA